MDDLVQSIKNGNVADAIVTASRLAREAVLPSEEGRRVRREDGSSSVWVQDGDTDQQQQEEQQYNSAALLEKLALSRDTTLSIEESMRCVTLPDMRAALGPVDAKLGEIGSWRRRLRSHLHRVEVVLVQLDSLGSLPPSAAAERKAAVDRMEASLVPVERMLRLLDTYEELISLVHTVEQGA
mmetsp:Transcript_698/g.2170  ORF Transcript_698/g.2170 Transcript_698/m.2170 type:complete len:182 (-) Transcript_698:448-993(-)